MALGSIAAAVDNILAVPANPPSVTDASPGEAQGSLRGIELAHFWFDRIAHDSLRPMQGQISLFWYGHFISNLSKVIEPERMQDQIDLYRREALANYNGGDPKLHGDETIKAVLGNQVVPANAANVANRSRPSRQATAEFFSRKFWIDFANQTPPPAVIAKMRRRLLTTGFDITPWVCVMLISDEFYDDSVKTKLVRSPIEWVVSRSSLTSAEARSGTVTRRSSPFSCSPSPISPERITHAPHRHLQSRSAPPSHRTRSGVYPRRGARARPAPVSSTRWLDGHLNGSKGLVAAAKVGYLLPLHMIGPSSRAAAIPAGRRASVAAPTRATSGCIRRFARRICAQVRSGSNKLRVHWSNSSALQRRSLRTFLRNSLRLASWLASKSQPA
jgi:hypothetical protein